MCVEVSFASSEKTLSRGVRATSSPPQPLRLKHAGTSSDELAGVVARFLERLRLEQASRFLVLFIPPLRCATLLRMQPDRAAAAIAILVSAGVVFSDILDDLSEFAEETDATAALHGRTGDGWAVAAFDLIAAAQVKEVMSESLKESFLVPVLPMPARAIASAAVVCDAPAGLAAAGVDEVGEFQTDTTPAKSPGEWVESTAGVWERSI